jgi:hypothetical protein
LRGDLIAAENAELARLFDDGAISAVTAGGCSRPWTWKPPGCQTHSSNGSSPPDPPEWVTDRPARSVGFG